MKLWGIVRFELAYQLRRPWPWLIFALLFVFAFLMTRDNSLAEALHDDFFVNSPFSIAKTTVAGSLIWLLIAAMLAGEAAARDVATRMHPLAYTVPITKAEYLGGRFLAALALNTFVLLAVQLGIVAAVYAPGIDAAVIGPFRLDGHLTAFGFLTLPNMLAAVALQFAFAMRRGRPMAAYLGSLLIFVSSYIVATFLLIQGRKELTNLFDAIGIHLVLSDLSHMWTPAEKSTRLLALEGAVLTNRLVWIGIALLAIAITYVRFRFAHPLGVREQSSRPKGGAAVLERARPQGGASLLELRQQSSRTQGGGSAAALLEQTVAIAWQSFRSIATSWAGIALLIPVPLLTILVVLDQMYTDGVALEPTTALVIRELTSPLSSDPLANELSRWVIVPLLIIFFAGELVWRERDAGVSEITDAMPGSEWRSLLGKYLGLGMLLAVFLALLMAAGIAAQLIRGYEHIDVALYLKTLFGLQLPEYLLFALLALAVHVVANQKYVGHMIAVVAYVFIAAASLFGVEHNLLIYGGGPRWSYTEMRGFGVSLAPWASFKLYWAAWALLLAVIARLLWPRGKENRFATRLRLARRRITRSTMWTGAAAVVLILAAGGFIFYNTNVLNDYVTTDEEKQSRADYERKFGRHARVPQPRLAATKLRVELDPDGRKVDILGTYRLVNRTTAPIGTIHLATMRRIDTRTIAFDRPANLVVDDPRHRVYSLAQPLQPGETLQLDFELHAAPRGFRNGGADGAIAPDGTFLKSGEWLPAIGYQRDRELTSAADRRAFGLSERPQIPPLHDAEARKDRDGATEFEAIVGTRADQMAVMPGDLRRMWTEGGRRYFHYATSAPIGNVFGIYSANYVMREARWNDVAIRIFHHPKHGGNVERILNSTRASFDYYTQHFGPYPYRHLTYVEIPGAPGNGLHADPTVISHGESFPVWKPSDDRRRIDMPYAVIAHEMGHQWNVPAAFVEGAPVMSESLAWYYGMKLVEHSKGIAELRRLLAWMRQPHHYPPIRRGEPLLRALDPYMSYRRGPFALYLLSETIGAERLNLALRRLLEKHRPQDAPLATTLDLYRELQAVTPDAHRSLLRDLFEVNTFWQLAVDKVAAKQTAPNAWQVTLELRVKKVVYDEAGVEREKPMTEEVTIGVFAPSEEGYGALNAPLYLRKHRLGSGRHTITVTVPGKPAFAGIDPFHLLDWEQHEDDDNLERLTIADQ